MPVSTDSEIRSALHRKTLKRMHARPDTLVFDELGLAHASVRIDIAVLDGCLHGFEIKSAVDKLSRLPLQLRLYEECLEKLTIVCAERHLAAVLKIAPSWCGIIEATKGPRGAIDFNTARRPRHNPNVQPDKLAHLLWRPEVIQLLERMNTPRHILKKPRALLCKHLAELLTIEEITSFIREFMLLRKNWRDGLCTSIRSA
jgi:hypothetical protein